MNSYFLSLFEREFLPRERKIISREENQWTFASTIIIDVLFFIVLLYV